MIFLSFVLVGCAYIGDAHEEWRENQLNTNTEQETITEETAVVVEDTGSGDTP